MMDSLPSTALTHRETGSWNEQACVQDCIRGHIKSQEQFYKRFYPGMMAVVLRYTNDPDDAVSILHNGFLKVFRNLHSFRFEGSLEGWVKRIIIHAVSDYFRHKHPLREVSREHLPEPSSTLFPDHSAYDYQVLLRLLNTLPTATRAVVNLFIIDGYSHKEIAAILHISENTSKWHVAEGRRLLQIKMAGR